MRRNERIKEKIMKYECGICNFDGTVVFFCNSEEEAKNFLKLPADEVVGHDYNPFLPENLRVYTPVKKCDVSRIQVDYHDASPFRVKQMSVFEWKRHLGLLPKRKKLPVERTSYVEALASCMMKNGVR